MSQEECPTTSETIQRPRSYFKLHLELDKDEGISKQLVEPCYLSYSETCELSNLKNSKSDESVFESPIYCLGLSKRQWRIFTALLLADFLGGVVFSIKGPLYPPEAESKGAVASQYGFVFGIFELTRCIASPIFGHFMYKLGSRNVFKAGVVIAALGSIFFGMLHGVDNVTSFVTYSFLIRILEGFGNAAFATAAFVTIICEFPNSIATAFAVFETTFGVGWFTGPVLGGFLYELGGYPLPFIVTGCLLFFSAVIISFVMPAPLNTVNEADKLGQGNTISNTFLILRLPGVVLAAFAILVAAATVGFMNASLEPHIRQFQLSPVQVAIVFAIFSTVYAIFSPIWGAICDRWRKPSYVLFCGTALNTISFLLIGPAPFFNVETYLWVTSLGLLIQGLGVSAVFVSGFSLALKYSINHGIPDNISTYSVISALWTSATAFGMFIGPSAAGLLMDQVGFRWGSLFLLILCALLAVMITIFIVVDAKCTPSEDCSTDQNEECEYLITLLRQNEDINQDIITFKKYGSVG